MPLDDFSELLHRVRASDEQAFAVLWRRYQPMVLRYARALTGDGADDVASETWLSVVRSLDRFSGDEVNFRTWLMTICRNRAMDWGRSKQRDRLDPQEHGDLERVMSAFPDTAAVVVDALSAAEAVDLIGRRLPPAQAEAVILRTVVGLEVAEVARIMGRRPGTVRVLTHRGLRQLQQVLAAQADVSRR